MSTLAPLSAALCCMAVGCALAAAQPGAGERPILLPTPKKVTWLDGRVTLSARSGARACLVDATGGQNAVITGISQLGERLRSLGAEPIPVVSDVQAASGTLIWVGTRRQLTAASSLLGEGFALPKETCVPDGYVLRCAKEGGRDVVLCAGYDPRGCYYGLQTLIQLLSASKGVVSLPRVDIADWPSFRLRLVKTSSTSDDPATMARWTDLLPRYKMNVLASQWRPAPQSGTWRKPGKTFEKNAGIVARAGRTTDTFDPMLYLSPFGKDRGSLLDPQVIEDYIGALSARISQGYRWIGVDFNDWGTYGHLSAAEQARFKDIGEAMTWLTNEAYSGVRARHPEAGFIAVPAVPYYRGLPEPELIAYCKGIPKDIMVITTGPVTRSTKITAQWLRDWAAATGRKPFLWDNTIYCHLDQYRPIVNGFYNFNAYEVEFPADMPKLLAGPGIHLNGGAARWREPGVLTFLDYMWNPEAYDPKTSLRNAQILLWGKDAPEAADNAQRLAAELYEYLFNANADKAKGSQEEALAKYAELEKAVRRLAGIIGDPAASRELGSDCLAKARNAIARVFPEAQAR